MENVPMSILFWNLGKETVSERVLSKKLENLPKRALSWSGGPEAPSVGHLLGHGELAQVSTLLELGT
jgi:hypothetical protein